MADSSALTLGEAIVEIGGDLTKLQAAFAEARRMRDQFDADMVSSSGGLLKFTTAANDAGEAVDKTASKTKTTGDAAKTAAADVDKLTEAQARQTTASKAASDALETEAQKTARLSAMVDASIAKLNERNRISAASTGGLIGSAVPKEPGLFEAQNAMMGIGATGKIGLSAAEGAAAAEGVKIVENEVENLGGKTKISSLAIREMLVLVREAGRGDFTRMAGSASLLASNLGLIEAIGAPLLGTLGALALVVGGIGVVMFEASKQARLFENELLLTGNRAGLTASSYEDMAARVGRATMTSISSNKMLISDLAKTNDFTAAQLEQLVAGAQTYARATGQSAEAVAADFAKMSEGPTKYALAFEKAHVGTIMPLEMNHIRELEARGEKEKAIAELINITMDEIKKHTIDDLTGMEWAWASFQKTLSNGWQAIKNMIVGAPISEQIATLDSRIAALGTHSGIIADQLFKKLEIERAALQETLNVQEKKAAADSAATEAQQKQDSALERTNDQYLKGIDSRSRFNDAVHALNKTLADDVKMTLAEDGKNLPAILEAASKSAIPAVRDLAAGYHEQVEKIKKDNLPDVFKADAKAARDAASALKKLENAAAALEKRRQEAIASTGAEVATLKAVLPLYQDHSMTLDQLNRAKAITVELSKLKLSADSAEGKQIAVLVGQLHDLNKAVSDSTKEWADLDSMEAKTDSIRLQTSLLGKYGEELVYETLIQEKMNEAIKQHRILTDEDILAIDRAARAQAKATADQQKAQAGLDYSGGGLKQPTGADMRAIDQLTGGKYKAADDLKTINANLKQQQLALDTAYDISLRKDKEYLDKKAALEANAARERQVAEDASINLRLTQGEQVAQGLETIAAAAFGKQSAAYRAAFILEKEFTIAKAALALERAIADAASQPFPANIPAIIEAVAEGAQIASAISAISLNMAGGGMIYGPGSGTSDSVPVNASNGEFMINAMSTAAWRPQLEDINAGRMPKIPGNDNGGGGRAPTVTINNLASGVSHDVSTGLTMDDVIITAKRVVAQDAARVVASDLNSPNSRTSKALQARTNTTRRRR